MGRMWYHVTHFCRFSCLKSRARSLWSLGRLLVTDVCLCLVSVLPRCMEWRSGLAMTILPVGPSVCQTLGRLLVTDVCLCLVSVLPRCIEWRSGLAMTILPVGQTRAMWPNGIRMCPEFFYYTENNVAEFSDRNVWWGRPCSYVKFLVNRSVGAKRPSLNRYSLVAPQP